MRGRIWPFLLFIAVLYFAGSLSPLRAQVFNVQVQSPRPAGWMLGDVVPVTITIDSGQATLQQSSLPRPGPLNYWLDLRSLQVQHKELNNGLRYTLTLHYQTFYVPLDVNQRQIPALDLLFSDGAQSRTIRIPPQDFFMSPLRGVAHSGIALSEQIQPDVPARQIDKTFLQNLVVGLSVLTALWLIALASHYCLWPFHRRRTRPLARAHRAIKQHLRVSGAEAYRRSLIELHRALDHSNGARLLASDVAQFVQQHAFLKPVQTEIERFFSASALVFFGDDQVRALSELPPAGLVSIAKRLAAAERKGV